MFNPNKLQRLQNALRQQEQGAMYVRDTANIAWLTGFDGVFDDEQAHALLVPATGERMMLHSDSRYITALQREAQGQPVQVDADTASFAKWAQAQTADLSLEGSVAIETSITLSEFRTLERAFSQTSVRLQETDGLIVGLRAQKTAEEIERMRQAQAITDAAFSHIASFIRPGLTERQVQLELDTFMLQNGAEALAFSTIVASGEHGASPHAVVTDKPLQPGECVVMDFGARRGGYCSDMTRVIFLGEPTAEMQSAWDTLRKANETVQAALRPGVTGADMHTLALSVLEEGGFGGLMGHGLGHGVGLEIHELPVLSPRNDNPLEVGNVVTVEPGIYVPGAFGMRLEDFGVITEQGFECFTQSTHDMVVV